MSSSEQEDCQARLDALDTTQSYIVQAPAGSGKTSLLLSRYICLLEKVSQPEEVLAVTFTKKATRNMRDKILKVLDPDSGEDLPQEEMKKVVQRVRERSENLGWHLLENPARLQIMTIDALVKRLVSQMPWSSRLGTVTGVANNVEDLFEAAAAASVDLENIDDAGIREALKTVLHRIDNRSSSLQRLIVEMLGKRDQWLRFVALEQFGDESHKSQVERVWRAVQEKHLAELVSLIPADSSKLLVKVAVSAARHLQAAGSGSHALSACLNMKTVPGTNVDSRKQWLGIAQLLLTNDGKWRKRADKRIGIPANDEILKIDYHELLAKLDEVDGLREQLDKVRNLPDDRISDEDWEAIRSIIKILPYAVAQLKLEFRRQGKVDFIELAQQAAVALGTADNPTDLSLVLDYKYQHILVDEFQDTSLSQKLLLENLIGGWQDGDDRTLFLVGDPMQSIYRFREAEVGIYLEVRKEGLGSVKPIPLTLYRNFRSNQTLVNWFNEIFGKVFPETENNSLGQVKYSNCISEIQDPEDRKVNLRLRETYKPKEDGEKVDRTVVRKSEKDKQARLLFDDLQEYLKKPGESDAVILVRSRSQIYRFIPLLQEHGIRYYAHDVVPLEKRPVVKDILALTRALLFLADRTSWLAVLRAPWCGMDLNDMLVVASAEGHDVIWNAINDDDVVGQLTPDGQKRIIRVREVLQRAFKAKGREELRYWLEDTWTLLGGPGCAPKHDVENAQIILDLIADYGNGFDVKDLLQFEHHLENLYAIPEYKADQTQVTIMTIHGSKGLEFDAVFIPFLEAIPRRTQKPLMVWGESNWTSGERILLSSSIPQAGDKDLDLKYQYLRDWNSEKDILELTRLIYVACTRAKRELYLYGTVNKENMDSNSAKTTILSRLWDGLKDDEFLPAEVPEDPDAENQHQLRQLSRLPVDWSLPEPPAALELDDQGVESPGDKEKIDFDWAGNIARGVGTVVHEWLHRISKTGIKNWSKAKLSGEEREWKLKLTSLGVTGDQMPEALDRTRKALINVLDDERGRWLLRDDHQDAEAEWRLTGCINGQIRNVILDRTFVDESGVRWIVDYKTGYTAGSVEKFLDEEKRRYQNQLEQYALFISRMENRPVRLGLYFPLHKEWREWSYDKAVHKRSNPVGIDENIDDIKRVRYNSMFQ